MDRGYIKLYRKILDSGIIQNPHALQLFIYLLLNAAYKPVSRDVRGELIRLEPGQYICGRKKLAEKLEISEMCVRTALKYLEKAEIITIRTTKRYSVVSIMNWHTYQTKNLDDNHQNNHVATMSQPCGNHEPTMWQPSGNHEITTVKEFKKLRSEESKKLSINNLSNTESGATAQIVPQDNEHREEREKARAIYQEAEEDWPSIEFVELRNFYDKKARPEGPDAGWIEFKSIKKSRGRYFPGIYKLMSDISERVENGFWDKGFEPGLGKYLRERTWEQEVTTRQRDEPVGYAQKEEESERRRKEAMLKRHQEKQKEIEK